MKKVFLSTLMVVFVIFSSLAQKGDKSLGLNWGYGTEIKSVALGAKFNYSITDPIEVSPSFNYFLKKDGTSAWEINADVHYLFYVTERIAVYPLAGLTVTGWKTSYNNSDLDDFKDEWGDLMEDEDFDSGSSSTSKFGLNLGGGIKYNLTEKVSLGAELKYSLISDFDQVVIGVNLAYKF